MAYRIESLEMTISQLQRERTVWIYSPEMCDTDSQLPLPVIYMQNGQNLFYKKLSQSGKTWKIAQSLQRLEKAFGYKAIVVGIESNSKHPSEYSPWTALDDQSPKNGEGVQFAEFLVKTLKPKIESMFKTSKEGARSAIAGSASGAFFSLYTALSFQRIFQTVGLFSVELPTNRTPFARFLQATQQNMPQKVILFCGGQEGQTALEQQSRMDDWLILYRQLTERGMDTQLLLTGKATACENAWATCFEHFAFSFLTDYYHNN